jgi:tRNA(fMet)-specific endonuclease VapC
MTLAYLLDTNILAEPLRPTPNARVIEKLKAHEHQLAIPSVVWHEMWFGCNRLSKSNRRSLIERYLMKVIAPSMPVLPYDILAAEYHAAERARLASLGKTPSFVDGQIAAVAHANELVLVTVNISDFREFREIQLEDWSN